MLLTYFLITLCLFAAMLLYFRIADKYNIIDKPNQRSSHTTITLRGGGIIFPVAQLLFFLFFASGTASLGQYALLLTGMLLIGMVSFWDDVSSLSNKVRLLMHLLSVTIMLYAVQAFQLLPWWMVVITYVMIIGTINAYNFMDGINGITGVYSLAILLSCLYFNERMQTVVHPAYLIVPVLACLVFLFFNFRKKAKCFAGDVGSVSIGFWIISVLLLIIIATGDAKYIFFLSVYGVDAILTIVHRLLLRQNIFEAHRLHFYQILANERKVSHLVVSSAYGVLQLAVNAFILGTSFGFVMTGLLVCVPLALAYVLVKPRIMAKAL
jgi:UDP-N-acetylmuramyl pentapeptide phosphotransferase/UDP-N-acetylglucosamine-1-phosphate transferase